jgi:hypothetical protein
MPRRSNTPTLDQDQSSKKRPLFARLLPRHRGEIDKAPTPVPALVVDAPVVESDTQDTDKGPTPTPAPAPLGEAPVA